MIHWSPYSIKPKQVTEQKKEKMEEERAEKLRTLLDSGLHQLYGLWDEIGEEDCF